MTTKQEKIIYFLESLVGSRFNIDSLNKYLSEFFEEDIKAEFVNEDDDTNELGDWNIMFDSVKPETYGYFDIYVLKMRKPSFDGSDFYITEVGYEFDGVDE